METLGGKKLRRNRRHLKQTGAEFRHREPENDTPSGYGLHITDNQSKTSNQSETSNQSKTSSQSTPSQKTPSQSTPSQSTPSQKAPSLSTPSQSVSQQKPYETRSGRSVKAPSKYEYFVLDGKVNIISSEIFV